MQEALAALIGAAADECGLVPTGHKFVLYAPWLQHDLRAVTRAQLAEMHDDLDGYTPPDDLAAGRCCLAQDVGVLAAGVPIGGARYYASRRRVCRVSNPR